MAAPEDVIRRYVEAISAPDGDAAAALTADDAVIELPNGDALKGKEGARQFAAKHAESERQKRSVTLTSLEARTPHRFVATLEMTNREVAADELLYSMDVGSVFDVRDGLIVRHPGLSLARRGRRRGGVADRRMSKSNPES
ncbi:MAG: nuclear transport factor 2 family protein [Candidatus Rokuibacteriota bacterium]